MPVKSKSPERKLPPTVDYDLFGHCIICHRNMLEDKMIDGVMVQVLNGDYRETEYLLDTGSKMRVAMCVQCKTKLTDTAEEMSSIIKTVIKGWEIETDDLVSDNKKSLWTKQHKEAHMKEYRKRKIDSRIEGLSSGTIKSKVKLIEDKKK